LHRGADAVNRMRIMTSQRTGIIFALLAALCYGCVPTFARLAFEYGAPVLHTVVLRTLAVIVVMGAVALLARQSFRIPAEARFGFLLQFLATGGVSIFYLISVQYIPVALSVIIFFTFPVIILLVSPLVEGTAPNLVRLAIGLAAFGGLAIAAGPQFETLDLRGIVFAFMGAACCALQFFAGRMSSRFMEPAAYAALVHVVVIPVILIASYLMTGPGFVYLGGAGLPWSGYLAGLAMSLGYVIAFFFHMSSLRHARPATVAPFFNLEPVIGTLAAIFILGEVPAANHYLGGAIVLAALFACAMLEARKPEGVVA
jgi:drug/metabolite transporter (DMT)-like permease